ncbi:MAG: protein kinase [Deltaproteobacteria bacterium]|nr:protein kinase [Deltaproteobacteria bacterium]
MDRTGQTLENKYTLLRLVGEGGMGAVYEARHALIHRRCAVKFLHAEAARDADQVKRFVREAQAASAVAHPGIVDVYDVGVAPDGVPYLVMELLEGESLAACLERVGRLPVADAVEIVVAALAALAAAHRAGIVHRDLKPGNLFLERGTVPGPRVKLLDFGISRVTSSDDPRTRMTRTGAVLGTPCYMAPEQAGGLRDVDHRLDLYAIGVILYECLTGRLPFEADNYNRLIVMICSEPFPRPREVEPAIPEGLEAVILKGMSRRREDRYADADEMIRALTPFLAPDAAVRLGLASTPAPAPARSSDSLPAFSLEPSAPVVGRATTASGGSPRRSFRVGIVVASVALIAAGVAATILMGRNHGDGAPPPEGTTTVGTVETGLAASRPSAASSAAGPGTIEASRSAGPAEPRPRLPPFAPDPSLPSAEPDAGGAAGAAAADAGPSTVPSALLPASRPDAAARRAVGSTGVRPGPPDHSTTVPTEPSGPSRADAGTATTPGPADAGSPPLPAIEPASAASIAVGFITVRALPRSDVYLDGRHLGATPVPRTEVPAGPHSLRLVPRPDSVAPGEVKTEQVIPVIVAEGATENVVRYY